MLTDRQKETFKDLKEGKLTAKQKADFYYRMSNILKDSLEGLEDLSLILKEISYGGLEKIDLAAAAISAMKLTEVLLQLRDPWSIGAHEDGEARAFRSWGFILPAGKPEDCAIHSISRMVTDEDIKFYLSLRKHFENIRFYVDPCFPDPVCRDLEYIRIQDEKAFQIAKDITNKTGKPLSVSIKTYEGRIKIEQLQKMRWKPRGLVTCTDLPPLLEEPTRMVGRTLSIGWSQDGPM